MQFVISFLDIMSEIFKIYHQSNSINVSTSHINISASNTWLFKTEHSNANQSNAIASNAEFHLFDKNMQNFIFTKRLIEINLKTYIDFYAAEWAGNTPLKLWSGRYFLPSHSNGMRGIIIPTSSRRNLLSSQHFLFEWEVVPTSSHSNGRKSQHHLDRWKGFWDENSPIQICMMKFSMLIKNLIICMLMHMP